MSADLVVSHVLLERATPPVRSEPVSAPRRLGIVLICAAAVLAAWACWLGATLPVDGLPQASSLTWVGVHTWRLAWVGLDALEVAGLLATGIGLRRRHWTATVSALVTLPLFVLDAWFDVMTSASDSQLQQALAMAVLVELPTASVLAWVARSGTRTMRAAADAGQHR